MTRTLDTLGYRLEVRNSVGEKRLAGYEVTDTDY